MNREVRFLLHQREYCHYWLDQPEDKLPGTLTRDYLWDLLEDTEHHLLDYAFFDSDGKIVYK